ncbi:MAG: hypothetical protein IJ191_00210 [Treponema sp.]|nr:hypothetical protein [Treponema sp.]
MGYESVDKLQNLLAETVFGYTTDKKKAAGRALGTFLEIITYYLIKAWKLDSFAAIERPLPEFANKEITHNVEFTLHGSKKIAERQYQRDSVPISGNAVIKTLCLPVTGTKQKTTMLIGKDNVLRNACTLVASEKSFFNAYVDTKKGCYSVYELYARPFAMFECKRVGVEEGSKKGPQTIEKAKQGSYVARTVSALQRVRKADGTLAGFLQKSNTDYIIDDYYKLLSQVIASDEKALLKNFILTVGVISNHGNWFTSENPNKELKVLAQSYDWLLFLTDKGISEFITDLLISPDKRYVAIKTAFQKSYSADKKGNVFTKIRIDYDSDRSLCDYFASNMKRIESWFNVISPKNKSLVDLRSELSDLSQKNWEEIYADK